MSRAPTSCSLIRVTRTKAYANSYTARPRGDDGVYFTYSDERPISFNPFYTDDYVFDVEKRESICTLLLTLWKSSEERITKTEAGELGRRSMPISSF